MPCSVSIPRTGAWRSACVRLRWQDHASFEVCCAVEGGSIPRTHLYRLETHRLKLCKKCGEKKPLESFSKDKQSKDGKQWCCKVCDITRRLEHRVANPDQLRATRLAGYSMTINDYSSLFVKQNGQCAICYMPSDSNFHVDHDHACCSGPKSCGVCVRGLLCTRCNLMLGIAKDSVSVLRAGARYLEAST